MTLDAPARRRFGRQIRLAEVGERGQARLCTAEVAARTSGTAAEIETRYLEAAGLRISGAPAPSPPAPALDLGLRHAAPRAVAEGALAALLAIRDVLAREGA